MNKYTFKITRTNKTTSTITVYASDSRLALDLVERMIDDVQAFEIISVEKA